MFKSNRDLIPTEPGLPIDQSDRSPRGSYTDLSHRRWQLMDGGNCKLAGHSVSQAQCASVLKQVTERAPRPHLGLVIAQKCEHRFRTRNERDPLSIAMPGADACDSIALTYMDRCACPIRRPGNE